MTWSVWLLPCEEDATILQGIADRLCDTAGVPRFPVHLTVRSGIEGAKEAVLMSLRSVQGPVTVRTNGVRVGQRFHRCIFLETQEPGCHIDLPGAAPSPAHLSLLYGEFPDDRKRELQKLVENVPELITFDRIQLVRTDGHYTGWEPLPPIPLAHITAGR